MAHAVPPPRTAPGFPHRARAILLGGTVGGALDLLFALVQSSMNGMAPSRLLQIIAAGLLGRAAAFDHGAATAALGLALHFAMSLLWAAAFVVVLGRYAVTLWRAIALGIAFGTFVFAFMRGVVLPLSALQVPFAFRLALVPELLAHMLLFGTPIALAAFAANRRARGAV